MSSQLKATPPPVNYWGMIVPIVLLMPAPTHTGLSVPFQTMMRSLPASPIRVAMLDFIALEQAAIAEINRVRANPAAYADWLETQRQVYHGTVLRLPGEVALQTNQGTQALDEAVRVLRSLSPMPPLVYSPGISQGARDQVLALGSQGLGGTIDQAGNNLGTRINQYGKWRGSMVAVPSYQKQSAQAIVFHQIVGDGDRQVRQILFDPTYQFWGLACGHHRQRETMCLFGFANQYTEQDGSVAMAPVVLPPPTVPSQPEPTATPIVPPAPVSVPSPAIVLPASNPSLVPSVQPKLDERSVIAQLTEPELRALEQDILTETNRLRTNPSVYANELEALKPHYKGKNLRLPTWTFQLETAEGIAAVAEAIQALRQTSALANLTYSEGMTAGARDHLQDLIRNNLAGHIGSNGNEPIQRVQRYGKVTSRMGENISYSPLNTARHHLSQLLIDDDVPDRGHRRALLNLDYRVMGVACGIHPSLGHTCVMTYADGYQESR